MTALESYGLDLLEKVKERLLEMQLDHPRTSDWAKKAIPYLEGRLEELYAAMLKYPFAKRSEEIRFFKGIKPELMGRLIYACEVHNIQVARPLSGTVQEKEYLAALLADLDSLPKKNPALYQ